MDIDIDYSGNTIGKYRLDAKLGKGSFGAVYRATDLILSTPKAVKILRISDPQKAHELFVEAAIPHKCQHSNIVKINSGELAVFNEKVYFIIDMELVNGGSLEKILLPNKLSTIDCVMLAKNILFGLQHAHTQGVIHRDIKPANILIDNLVPKISDFGLASSLNTLIVPWEWYYTHAAPETFKDSTATIGTDIFAFGITFYRMIHHIIDWDGFLSEIPKSSDLMRTGKLIDKIPFSPHIPGQLVRIIKKSCNANPEKRYRSATEMRNALEKLKPRYSWLFHEDDKCVGKCKAYHNRVITLERKAKHTEFIVKNGSRRIIEECCRFFHSDEAELHMLQYLAKTTFH